ncbi:MAG: hypothetical protein IKM20_03440 [Erysipelotrichales bacterium]|nr:hypothetical protein [Erysipelotrichales bacterium]
MNILLVSDTIFNPDKPKAIYNRFVSKCTTEALDALCITLTSSQYLNEIEAFKHKYSGKYPIILGNDIDLRIYDEKYPLMIDGIKVNDETIYAMDDAVCEIEFTRDQPVQYRYVPLDIFMNMKPAKKQESKIININGLDLMNGQPIAIPLQKFLDIIEENMDEETKERLRKAKQDINEKTKS